LYDWLHEKLIFSQKVKKFVIYGIRRLTCHWALSKDKEPPNPCPYSVSLSGSVAQHPQKGPDTHARGVSRSGGSALAYICRTAPFVFPTSTPYAFSHPPVFVSCATDRVWLHFVIFILYSVGTNCEAPCCAVLFNSFRSVRKVVAMLNRCGIWCHCEQSTYCSVWSKEIKASW
jgi:hypothetical protein